MFAFTYFANAEYSGPSLTCSLVASFFEKKKRRYENVFLALGLAAAAESAALEGASSFLGDFAEVEDVVRLGVVLQLFVSVFSNHFL